MRTLAAAVNCCHAPLLSTQGDPDRRAGIALLLLGPQPYGDLASKSETSSPIACANRSMLSIEMLRSDRSTEPM